VIDEHIVEQIEAGVYKMSKKEKALLFRLLSCMLKAPDDCKYVKVVTFEKDENNIGKEATFLRLPHPTKGDSSANRRTQANRGRMVTWYTHRVGAGVNSLSKAMKKNAAVFSAARIKSGVANTVLDVGQSLKLQSELNLSHIAFRRLRKALRKAGAPVTFASEQNMQKAVSNGAVDCAYFKGVSLEANKSGEVKCLIYAANICDVLARDLDSLRARDDFKRWPFTHNQGIPNHM
jgi:hypothetical protein